MHKCVAWKQWHLDYFVAIAPLVTFLSKRLRKVVIPRRCNSVATFFSFCRINMNRIPTGSNAHSFAL